MGAHVCLTKATTNIVSPNYLGALRAPGTQYGVLVCLYVHYSGLIILAVAVAASSNLAIGLCWQLQHSTRSNSAFRLLPREETRTIIFNVVRLSC